MMYEITQFVSDISGAYPSIALNASKILKYNHGRFRALKYIQDNLDDSDIENQTRLQKLIEKLQPVPIELSSYVKFIRRHQALDRIQHTWRT